MIQNKLKVLGITGGIGSGKSEVLHLLEEADGVKVLEADRLAHELMKPGRSCHRRITECFGEAILDEDGSIHRGKLGQIVFRDQAKLEQLNRIVHPAVKKSIRDRIRRAKETELRIYVIEAALLIQDGYSRICDEIWYIHTEREIRLSRLLSSRGGNREKWEAVLNSQPSDAYFIEHCDRVIENSGSRDELRNRLEQMLRLLLNS